MMKIQAKVTEMKDAKAVFVSLVGKSSTRIPFRIVKQESGEMINLGNLFSKVLKQEAGGLVAGKEVTTPTITALVFLGKGDLINETVIKSLKDQDFKVDNMKKNEDGSVILKQVDDLGEDQSVIKVSENLAVILKGFSPYMDSMKDSSFVEKAKAKGFYDGLSSAYSVFNDSIYSAMSEAKNPSEAGQSVRKSGEEFLNYISTLIEVLPVKAFKSFEKVEEAISKMEKGIADEQEKLEKEKTETLKTSETPSVEEVVSKSLSEGMSTLESKMTELLSSLMEKALDPIRKNIDSVVLKAEDSTKVVDEIKATLARTVAGTPSDSEKPHGDVRKSEAGYAEGMSWDTAMISKRK